MEINKQILCPHCRGSGAKDENDVHTCTSCGGNGIKVVRHQVAPGFFQQVQQMCNVCGGQGKVIKTKCPHCRGEKTKRGSHEFTLEIEKGMGQGIFRLRVTVQDKRLSLKEKRMNLQTIMPATSYLSSRLYPTRSLLAWARTCT
jgi:DnaJ-class molecular chaperone